MARTGFWSTRRAPHTVNAIPGHILNRLLEVVPAALRADLAADVPFSTLELERQSEARDGTVKALFSTWDGKPVEAVLMRYRDGRRSICVSSQSGCPLTCTFCATGQMRFGRNLTASEILDQALHFRRIEAVDHCVFMGMGEPMLNLDAVLEAARRLPDLGIIFAELIGLKEYGRAWCVDAVANLGCAKLIVTAKADARRVRKLIIEFGLSKLL